MITGIGNNTPQRQNFGMAVKVQTGTYEKIADIATHSPWRANRMIKAIEQVTKKQEGNVLYDIPVSIRKGKLDFSLEAKHEKNKQHASDLAFACKSFFRFGTGASDLKALSGYAKKESDRFVAAQQKINASRPNSFLVHDKGPSLPHGQYIER